MNTKIQANERITYLKDIKEAVALKQLIDKLDKKYNVNSQDSENTFGQVALEDAIIEHGLANTLYFAGINTYRPEKMYLPTHEAIPLSESYIILDEQGRPYLCESKARLKAKKVPITIEEEDIAELKEKRQAFKDAIEANAPKTPELPHDWTKQQCDEWLTENGYADGTTCRFVESVEVPDGVGNLYDFEVSYYRLDLNRTPDFSTTYGGSQAQAGMNSSHPMAAFWRKWDTFHLHELTQAEYAEMRQDWDECVALSEKWAEENIDHS